MKSALSWVLGLALIAGTAGLGLHQYRQTTRETAYKLELASIKRDFITDTHGLHALEADRYRKEIGPHLNKYFRGLGKLAKEHPELYNVDRQRQKGEEALAKGHMTEATKLAREERIDITTDLLARMRDGQYRPLYTGSDNGFRFDIYDITPSKVAGENKVKFSFVHWGPFPDGHRPGSGPVSYKSIMGTINAEQEKGKPVEVPQIVGEAQPPSLQIGPEHWVDEFIPNVEIGYYDLPQFPRVATSIELTFTFGLSTVGGSELISNIQFPEIPIPEAWKVPEGQKWDAQERFASDEELQAAGAMPTQ